MGTAKGAAVTKHTDRWSLNVVCQEELSEKARIAILMKQRYLSDTYDGWRKGQRYPRGKHPAIIDIQISTHPSNLSSFNHLS